MEQITSRDKIKEKTEDGHRCKAEILPFCCKTRNWWNNIR